MAHLALVDSTGWGLVGSPYASAGILEEDGCFYVVSPGSSLNVKGQQPGQVALVEAVALGEDQLDTFFSGTFPIRVIAIKAEDSIAINSKKAKKMYKNMSLYRQDMRVPEFSRTINTFTSEFPELYAGPDKVHFSDGVAREAVICIINAAIEEALGGATDYQVVVVCAGWNAEPGEVSSMREAFMLRQLVMCKRPQDVLAWARLNAGISHLQFDALSGRSVPRMVHQTYLKEHAEAQANMAMMMGEGFQRRLWLDADCEEFIKEMLGSVVLAHYRSISMPAHRAVFFRYLLLFFQGGCYFDIKSALLIELEEILSEASDCKLVSCIGAGRAHIHQGILIAVPMHPLVHEAVLQAFSTTPSTLNRKGKYMTFCKQMWNILTPQLSVAPKVGVNITAHWGNVYLLTEMHMRQKKTITNKYGHDIRMDGHVAHMADSPGYTSAGARQPAVAIRCWGWDRGFAGDRNVDMVEVMLGADMNAAAIVHEDPDWEPRLLEPSVESIAALRLFTLSGQWYRGLSDDEIARFAAEGMIRNPEKPDYLSCFFHKKRGRHLEFQSNANIRDHFTKFGFHKGCCIPQPVVEPPVPLLLPVTDDSGVWATVSPTSEDETETEVSRPVPASRPAPSRSRELELSSISHSTQIWCAALVDLYLVVDKRSSTWASGIDDILPIPSQLIPFTGQKVGTYMYTFSSLLQALQNAHLRFVESLDPPPYLSQVHVESGSTAEDIAIGQFMGLISASLRYMVLEILGGQTARPLPVPEHHVLFIFAFIGVANSHSKRQYGSFRILPQFWRLSHGPGLLQSVKVEALCGDVRKYAPRKRTLAQERDQLLVGRLSRGDVQGKCPGSSTG